MHLLSNTFSTYHLEPSEEVTGSILTELQVAVVQNEIAKSAQLKLNVLVDPEHPMESAKQHSYLQGQIDILNHLLTCSEAAKTENLRIAISEAQNPPTPT